MSRVKPDQPFASVGEILTDLITYHCIEIDELVAVASGQREELLAVMNSERRITAQEAERLATEIGLDAETWLLIDNDFWEQQQ